MAELYGKFKSVLPVGPMLVTAKKCPKNVEGKRDLGGRKFRNKSRSVNDRSGDSDKMDATTLNLVHRNNRLKQ